MKSTADIADHADRQIHYCPHPRYLRHPRLSRIAAAAWAMQILIVAIAPVVTAKADDAWHQLRIDRADLLGTLSCTAASCHGSRTPRHAASPPAGQEFVAWLGANATFSEGRRHFDPRAHVASAGGDPHAHAAQRMLEPRFQEVLRRASQRADGSRDATMLGRCARCHDPLGMAGGAGHSALSLLPSTIERGIGCESCHGGGRRWLALHYERGISSEQLRQLGMFDTKNLLVRARLCAACHVGSADQDMNHDMLAAGHPPLRFELAAYEALLPAKHWDDRPRRAADPDYEAQLWAAGRIAAADAALELLEHRARRAVGERTQPDSTPWPEFAELRCAACHQALPARDLAAAQSALPLRAGWPAWQAWNVALASSLMLPRQADKTGVRPPGESFDGALLQIRAAIQSSAVPDHEELAALAAQARQALRSQANVSPEGVVLSAAGDRLSAVDILSQLDLTGDTRDWDTLCQQAAALMAVERSLADHRLPRAGELSLIHQRTQRIATQLRLPAGNAVSPGSADVERELATLRDELKRLLSTQSPSGNESEAPQ